jgi:uncharacterized protein (TIRG00374 family)
MDGGANVRGLAFKYAISILLGVGMLWLAFHDEDWSDFERRLQTVDMPLVWGYLLLFIAAHAIRIVRWGVLVRALGPVPWSSIVSTGAVGYMCIVVFPLRLGELVRPVLVRGQAGVSAAGAMATVVVERVIDGLLFVALFFVFLGMLPPSNNPAVGAVKAGAWIAGGVFLGTLIVLVGAYLRRAQTVNLIAAIGGRIHAGLTGKALGLLVSFLDGLKVLPDRRRITVFMALTVVYWAALGVGMHWLGHACHMPDLTMAGAFALLAVLVVGIMIPAGPGFAGTFELALEAGFSLLVLAPDSLAHATLYTVMLHITQLVVQVACGAAFMLFGKVTLRQVLEAV